MGQNSTIGNAMPNHRAVVALADSAGTCSANGSSDPVIKER